MRTVRIVTIGVGLVLFSATLASAQASRTWVSGVGDDANPCSRTAPCKTFAGAISKTATGGEINTLDPGGFGTVTITKSISIMSEHFAGVLTSNGANAIIVNGAGIHVVLRGLDINGLGTANDGIRFLAGASLTVENCRIYGFFSNGIEAQHALGSTLYVKDSVISGNASGGIFTTLTGDTVIDNVRLERNGGFGLRMEFGEGVVRNSVVAGTSGNGINATPSSIINVEKTVVSVNTLSGLRSGGSSTIRIGNSTVIGNTTGLEVVSGQIVSLGGNTVTGNGTDGTFTSTLPRL